MDNDQTGTPESNTFEAMPCLTYFDLAGRAEATRLAFAIGDIDFEDKRISFPDFATVGPTTPFKQLPVLEVNMHDLHSNVLAKTRHVGGKQKCISPMAGMLS